MHCSKGANRLVYGGCDSRKNATCTRRAAVGRTSGLGGIERKKQSTDTCQLSGQSLKNILYYTLSWNLSESNRNINKLCDSSLNLQWAACKCSWGRHGPLAAWYVAWPGQLSLSRWRSGPHKTFTYILTPHSLPSCLSLVKTSCEVLFVVIMNR